MSAHDDDLGMPLPADESVVARWSRRKHEAATTTAQPTDDRVAAPSPACPAKTDADMPSIDLLTADSDLSGFLSPGVSESLRREAMRKVFSQSRYNLVDGLDDYAEDYTRFQPLGDLLTAGLRRHRQRIAARVREACDTDADATAGPDPSVAPVADTVVDDGEATA
jgi:hypothetical protein